MFTELPSIRGSNVTMDSSFLYPGDTIDEQGPPEGKYQKFDFPNPFLLVCFYDKDIADGYVTLYPWQREVGIELSTGKNLKTEEVKQPTSKEPYKYCLLGSNGSGKDKFIIAPFSVWFTLTKIRSRVIITTASGVQLSSQTEPYIRDLCEKVNSLHGQEVFRIRQRYIKCLLTGSEIRMFATDESGKAEGYHPIDANSEMAVIVNEGKSVTEDIHKALRRCTGFNYWVEISSAGEPKGYLYYAYTKWDNVRRITSYECPHISRDEIKEDIELDGETSAFFRSKHLSAFTSISGQSVISMELVNQCLEYPPTFTYDHWPERVGIDLAAGGDEHAICFTKGNKVTKEYWFRERDATIASSRIDKILRENGVSKDCQLIFADDGGIGRATIDILNAAPYNWKINRVMNQWAALGNKKQFGNRGAENWWRVARIIEDKMFDLRGLSKKTIEQLYNRHYKQSITGGRIFLEEKREAKAHGRPSPDRADAFILSQTGLTVDDYIKDSPNRVSTKTSIDKRPKTAFQTIQEIANYYDDNETYGHFDKTKQHNRIFNSLRQALN